MRLCLCFCACVLCSLGCVQLCFYSQAIFFFFLLETLLNAAAGDDTDESGESEENQCIADIVPFQH